MRALVIAVMVSIATPALGQTSSVEPRTIDVSGHGKVALPPDTANIHYWIRGEGKTSDDATRAMVDSQGRVESGLRAFLGPDSQITNNDLVIIEVRDPNCKVENGRAALSEGQCAIIGYVAQIQSDVRTSSVAKSGTAVGLAGRLGARDARLQSFELRDTAKAREEAMTRAVDDARAQAQVLAAAAGGHLGRAVRIQYGAYFAPMVRGAIAVASLPPAPPPPPPVEVNMKPRSEDVSADVSVSYEFLP